MKNILTIFLFSAITFLVACNDQDDLSPFCQAIIQSDTNFIKADLDQILEGLQPIPTTEDPRGHLINLELLVATLNEELCVSASIDCYVCIETLPEQSEVFVEINDNGFFSQKVLDIATPYEAPMFFVGIHN